MKCQALFLVLAIASVVHGQQTPMPSGSYAICGMIGTPYGFVDISSFGTGVFSAPQNWAGHGSSDHQWVINLCQKQTVAPTRMNSCQPSFISEYGASNQTGVQCEASWDYVVSQPSWNPAYNAIGIQYKSVQNGFMAAVWLSCERGAPLSIFGDVHVDSGVTVWTFTLTGNAACAADTPIPNPPPPPTSAACILQTPSGYINLNHFGTAVAGINLIWAGHGSSSHQWSINLCQKQTAAPAGMSACSPSYISEYGPAGQSAVQCEGYFDSVIAQPSWNSATSSVEILLSASVGGYMGFVSVSCKRGYSLHAVTDVHVNSEVSMFNFTLAGDAGCPQK